MAIGFPVKANYAAGDILTAAQMNDLSGTLNYMDPTAKGDLFPASSGTALTRLAVGSDGETLVADSSTSTGLRYQGNYAAGLNKLLNSDFSIWQRGTSFSTNNAYTADRWYVTGDGTPTFTLSQQTFTPATAPVSGYEGQYFARYAVTSAGGSTYRQLQQQIEDVRTFAGQTITISFWARINSGTVTGNYVRWNQVFGSGGSATVNGSSNNFTLTSSWQRFALTTSVASVSGKTIGTSSYLSLDIVLPFTTTMSVDFWGVQVEAGSVATAFQTATGTLQGELAACQRYYYRQTAFSAYGPMLQGFETGGTSANGYFNLPVTLRSTPTAVEYSTLFVNDQGGNITITGITIGNSSQNLVNLSISAASGMVAGRPFQLLANNSTSAYLAVTAEL
jgi:hypothetical protein